MNERREEIEKRMKSIIRDKIKKGGKVYIFHKGKEKLERERERERRERERERERESKK